MSYKGVNAKSTPNNIIRLRQPVLSDRVMLVFSDMGTCYKVPVEELSCKLSDEGFTLFDLFDEAKENEKAVAFFEEGKLDFDLLFITQGGMLKRTEGKEYSLNKPVYQAIRLNEGDSLFSVEKFIPDEDNQTVFFVTQSGNCLNSKTDDIPVQGRVAGGVKGIMLAENDKVVFAKQINGEGEIIVATKQGRFKRVISCQIDPSPRYRKGCRIITFSEKNDEIIFAEYVTEPYYLAVSDGDGNMLAYDTEDISIEASTAKGRKLKGRSEEVCAVYALKFSQ